MIEEKQLKEKFLKMALDYKKSSLKEEQEVLGNLTPEEWANSQTRVKMLHMRQNKVAIAETGSKMRLIRTVLNIRSYTKEQLEKGFYVARYDFVPDYNDPEIKKMFVQIGMNNPLYKSVNVSNEPIEVAPPVTAEETEEI